MRKALFLSAALLGCAPTKEITRPQQKSNVPVAAEASSVRKRAQKCIALQSTADEAILNKPCGDEQFIAEGTFHWECAKRDPALASAHRDLHTSMSENVNSCASNSSVDAIRLRCQLAMNEYAEQFYGSSAYDCDRLPAQRQALDQLEKTCNNVRLSLGNPLDRRLQFAYETLRSAAVRSRYWCYREKEVSK